MCKLHYPTSHNTELFEFIELRAEFSHTDLTQFRIILSPLSADDSVKVIPIFQRSTIATVLLGKKLLDVRRLKMSLTKVSRLLLTSDICMCVQA